MMSFLASIGYSALQQDIITRETLELISQQTIVTQLVIILVIVIAVGGTIAFFTLRGGIKVFSQLSENIKKQSDIENGRFEEQKKTVQALERQTDMFENFFTGYESRVKNVDDMVKAIYDNVYYIKENVTYVSEIIANNPNDYRTLIQLLQQLNNTSIKAKIQTEELEKVVDHEPTS